MEKSLLALQTAHWVTPHETLLAVQEATRRPLNSFIRLAFRTGDTVLNQSEPRWTTFDYLVEIAHRCRLKFLLRAALDEKKAEAVFRSDMRHARLPWSSIYRPMPGLTAWLLVDRYKTSIDVWRSYPSATLLADLGQVEGFARFLESEGLAEFLSRFADLATVAKAAIPPPPPPPPRLHPPIPARTDMQGGEE